MIDSTPKIYYLILALLVLLLVVRPAHAFAGFYMNGVCYPAPTVSGTSSPIIESWESRFPAMFENGKTGHHELVFITYPTFITTGGVLTSRVDDVDLTIGGTNNGTVFSTQLMNCTSGILVNTTEGLLNQILTLDQSLTTSAPAYNYANGAALWAFSFSFVFLLWLLGKNIGLIMEVIKRF